MSKGSMLKLIERNGRGQSGLAAALPEQLHSQSRMSSSLDDPATAQRDNWSEGLAKLIGGPLPGPLGHPAAPPGAQKHGRSRLLLDKRVHRHAGSCA
jgi:hypothetical protein